jgi:hypothetical protein
MRPTIERIPNLNDLVESVPEEVVRQLQQESLAAEQETASENTAMPNDKKPNKSKRIRDYIDSHPNAAPKDIVAALSQYGVTPSDVGNVRSKLKGSKPGRRATAKSSPEASSKPASSASGASSSSVTGGINLKALEAGTQFLKEAGSLSNARELLIVIDRIRTY